MSARSLFEIATGIEHKARRTFQPVRRNSYHAGEREGRFWRPVNPKSPIRKLLSNTSML